MISGEVPGHLVVGARTGFLTTLKSTPMDWQRVATEVTMGAKSMDLVDLGAAPMPVENLGKLVNQSFVEKVLTIKPKNWEITVPISYNAIQDDQTGTLERKVKSAGNNFVKHINKQVFKALNNGDVAGNVGYDGATFFNDSHVDEGADYTTAQDNKYDLALSLDNFDTVVTAAAVFKDDRGEAVGYNHNLLIVPPALRYTGAQITGNAEAYDTASREKNPYAGKANLLVTPEFDSTAWVVIDDSEPIKPIIVGMRQSPYLQHYWFDPNQPDGGAYFFKFYARYVIAYGDWRLAIMGKS
jgi:phage major head subunit gpT-like protein